MCDDFAALHKTVKYLVRLILVPSSPEEHDRNFSVYIIEMYTELVPWGFCYILGFMND